ncbi:hypothetical protein NQ318_018530 [Aromia moschata]|uniref:Uncharacterized protein n=1 Tax=Aromia moschata TaxID=1265417 RepID=A0AAV8ZH50_9CUCU|nr:hypothetical protein NQ318_018530 [Aromia moschata]
MSPEFGFKRGTPPQPLKSPGIDFSSIIDVIQLYWNSLLLYLTDTFIALQKSESKRVVNFLENLPDSFCFNDFQWKLLKTFSILFVINLLLIVVVWKIHATLREIEELKASVSKLKLPKEHTPRI